MNKTVYGVYESNAEVIQAINALKAKGFLKGTILRSSQIRKKHWISRTINVKRMFIQ
ncbi:hypothetical protein RCO48_38940 [Peribacillus frigoritolerans]|nr:hypothetical protein [Peribacillus frigoritolerans]